MSRIRVDRQIYPKYAKIRLMRSEIKGFGTIVREILSEICEDPTDANPTHARFTVFTYCASYPFFMFLYLMRKSKIPDVHYRGV